MLAERVTGWRGYELRGDGVERLLLAVTPRFAAGDLRHGFDGIEEAARRCGLELTSSESAVARS